jgi:tetratricopeptide (TPR) repeat protein
MELSIDVGVLALTLLLVSRPAQAQTTYPIQGSIILENGITYEPLAVILEDLSLRPVDEVFVDVSGNFHFQNVQEGTYYVRISEEGFEEFTQRVEVPEYNRDMQIFLHRLPKSPGTPTEFVLGGRFQVDVRQLSIPEKALLEYRRALDDDKRGRISKAIQRLRRALAIAPTFVEAALQLGVILYRIDQLDDAEATIKQAIAVEPAEPRLGLLMANVYLKQGRYQQALSQIDAYLNHNPDGKERAVAEAAKARLMRAVRPRPAHAVRN